MSYNWEKICKNKTNKDLYKIVIGQTVLSKEAVHHAKAELDRRNFDYKKMELNKAAWRLSSLEDNSNLMFESRSVHTSIQFFLITTAGIILLYCGITYFNKIIFSIVHLLLLIGGYATIVLIQNFVYRKDQKTKKNRRLKIIELTDKLKSENILSSKNAISEDILRNRKIQNIEFNKSLYLFLVIAILFILIEIIIPINELF